MGGLPPQAPWQPPAPVPVTAASGAQMNTPPMPPPTPTITDAGLGHGKSGEKPSRRRRSLNIDKIQATKRILNYIIRARQERQAWMNLRLVRYAKLRGWRQDQVWPWEGANNQHWPIIQANSLRTQAGLFNAVMGNKPIMQGTSLRHDLKDKADKASNLIEFQLMKEDAGEQKIEQAIMQFVNDGTIFTFQPWVRDVRQMCDVRVISEVPNGETLESHAVQTLPDLIPGLSGLEKLDEDGERWKGTWDAPDGEKEVRITLYDREDERIDVEMQWDATVFDGPTLVVHKLEDIVVPLRSQNLQPVTPENPFGAAWVARLIKVNLDQIKRRMEDKTYDLLDADDFETLKGNFRTRSYEDKIYQEDRITREKEQQAGLMTDWADLGEIDKWITVIEWYGRWDVNGDGLEEDVIFWITQDGEKMLRARFLTEEYPGSPPRRPFAEGRFIPVDDAIYGIGLPELMEGMHDLLHDLINSNMDRGDVANLPIVLYRASSNMKNTQLRVKPGDWIAVDTPKDDVVPMNFPHANQDWSFQMISLVDQMTEKLVQQGSLQFGQVPQGKASALRTVGTTMAILQQGAAMPEQILRRFFLWLQQVYGQFHMLNTRFLPKKKEYLISGKPTETEDAYDTVTPQDIMAPVSFDFGATLLNTNKGLMAQALQGLGQAIFNPLSFQAGVTGPEQYWRWLQDLTNANQLDPMRYTKKPQGVQDGPPITANDAITALIGGQTPGFNFIEGPQAALQAIMTWLKSAPSDIAGDEVIPGIKAYVLQLTGIVQQAAQQQAMAQASQQFQTQMGNQGQGQGGAPGGPATTPPMQSHRPSPAEVKGGGMQGPPGSAGPGQ